MPTVHKHNVLFPNQSYENLQESKRTTSSAFGNVLTEDTVGTVCAVNMDESSPASQHEAPMHGDLQPKEGPRVAPR